MKENLTSRQKQAIETKNRIYTKTLELLKDKDYAKVTLQEICTNAEVSVGNFYNYFSSKEELIIQAYPKFDQLVDSLDIEATIDPIDGIKDIIKSQIDVIEDLGANITAQCLRIHLQLHGKYIIEDSRSFHKYIINLVEKAIEKKEINSELPASEIAYTILRISRGVIFDWSLRDGAYPLEERVLTDLENYLKILK